MKSYTLPDALALRVAARVLECWQTMRDRGRVPADAPAPSIRFYTGRSAAGLAHIRQHWVAFNGPLIVAHPDDMIRQTVAHEVAHCGASGLYSTQPCARPHGPGWRLAMMLLDVPADVSHAFDVEAAGCNVRRVARVAYVCACRRHEITPARVRKIAAGVVYRCKCCRAPLKPG